MSVSKTWKQLVNGAQISKIVGDYTQTFINKYYDIYCSKYKVKGFSRGYLKTFRAKLWQKGSVWIRKDAFTGEPICCDYAGTIFDWNNDPVQVQLITRNNAPESIIPTSLQTVGKDGVIVYIRPCEKGFEKDVMYYIGKMAEAETLITCNMCIQRHPWIITSDSENYQKLQQLLLQVFSDAPYILTDIDKGELETLDIKSEWLVDKLTTYQEALENKLKTILGIDNQGGHINSQQQNLDTTNSNNEEINHSSNVVFDTLKEGIDEANRVLGLHLSIEDWHEVTEQMSESKDSGNIKHEEEGEE